MLTIIVFGVFFVIALAGIPLYFAMIATTSGIVYFKDLPYQLDSLFLNLIAGVEPFILIAYNIDLAGEQKAGLLTNWNEVLVKSVEERLP